MSWEMLLRPYIWQGSQLTPFERKLFFVGRFKISNPLSFPAVGLFTFPPESVLVDCLSRNLSLSSKTKQCKLVSYIEARLVGMQL